MKKKIAIMLTLILAAGTFTACTAEEKVNNDIKASVVSKTADVSVSETTSVISTTSQIETKETAETGSDCVYIDFSTGSCWGGNVLYQKVYSYERTNGPDGILWTDG